jgi:glycine cleavage system aminomethyltransferase T
MVPFAGYELPVQYPSGILHEHLHTRSQAGLFDVSHMGQLRVVGPNSASGLERLVPGDLMALAPSHMRYTLLLNESGGIFDGLMATRLDDGFFLVVKPRVQEGPFPESREKNRFDARNRRPYHQKPTLNQPLTKQIPGAVRDGSEGGRWASEGASREGGLT